MENPTPQTKPSLHKQHADVARPEYGTFHRNEWAIHGAPCDVIRKLAFQLCTALSPTYKIAYADATHQSADPEPDQNGLNTAIANGAALEYSDNIKFHRFDYAGAPDTYRQRILFSEHDFTLLNGNHFSGKRQIVIVDSRKAASLQKKTDRLTRVDLILLSEGETAPFPFLAEHIAKSKTQMPPILPLKDLTAIIGWLSAAMQQSTPPLYGLVLAGGKSIRMGHDKSLIDYHGMPQMEYAARLLSRTCEKVFLSVRHDQLEQNELPFPLLRDTFLNLGPLSGLLSAFRAFPDAAWLTVACDLPLLDEPTIRFLTAHRHPQSSATAFISPVNQLPEPLAAIWEPRSYPLLLQFLAQGYSCPRKTLINTNVRLLQAPDPEALANVNFPEELEEIKKKLGR